MIDTIILSLILEQLFTMGSLQFIMNPDGTALSGLVVSWTYFIGLCVIDCWCGETIVFCLAAHSSYTLNICNQSFAVLVGL